MDYTVKYPSGRKSIGKYTITITGIGKYTGTKNVSFKINPKGTSISSISAKSKGVYVKWKKQASNTIGYQIEYSTSSSFKNSTTVTVSSNKTVSKTVKKLKAKKKYYVRVRTYKTVKSVKYYSKWSAKKYVTTKS